MTVREVVMTNPNGWADGVRRCPVPECRSTKLGCGEIPGGGANRFFAMCTECKCMSTKRSRSMVAAADADAEVMLGPGGEGIWLPSPTGVQLEQGDEKKPSVGNLVLDAVVGVKPSASPFRPVDEQERLARGEPVLKMFRCDGCQREAPGTETADNPKTRADPAVAESYFTIPSGWAFRWPSLRLFCSHACVKEDAAE